MGDGRWRKVVVHGASTALTVADPDLQIRVGGGRSFRPWDKEGAASKRFSALRASVWSKNKGGLSPPGPFPGSATDSSLVPRVLSYPSRENLGTRLHWFMIHNSQYFAPTQIFCLLQYHNHHRHISIFLQYAKQAMNTFLNLVNKSNSKRFFDLKHIKART